jgi:hypothetical protein
VEGILCYFGLQKGNISTSMVDNLFVHMDLLCEPSCFSLQLRCFALSKGSLDKTPLDRVKSRLR